MDVLWTEYDNNDYDFHNLIEKNQIHSFWMFKRVKKIKWVVSDVHNIL